jgi:hypothetical protein
MRKGARRFRKTPDHPELPEPRSPRKPGYRGEPLRDPASGARFSSLFTTVIWPCDQPHHIIDVAVRFQQEREEAQEVALVIVIVGVIGLALTFWNAANWYGFESTYRYSGEFQGNRYECSVRFANSERGSQCFIGANGSGLYLLSHPARKGWWRRYGPAGFNKNLQIPWSDLKCRAGTSLFKECMWFEVPSRKIHFYVPKDIGDKLLIDAQM